MELNSQKIYDMMAGEYSDVSKKKEVYLSSVNQIVVNHAPDIIKYYLDAGAGDGIRSMILAQSVKAKYTILIDSSREMVRLSKASNALEVHHTSIADYKSQYKFKLITCLWNVLGHINSKGERIESLINLGNMLDNDGIMIIDVSNKYNINYGIHNVIKNLLTDYTPFKSYKSGWFNFRFKNQELPVYLHSPKEFRKMVQQAGLKIVKFYGVDYSTGKVRVNSIFQGQSVFVIEKNNHLQ